MRALIHRGLTLGLRLTPPLLIIKLFNPEVLGQYYVFTTFFTLAVVLISLESSIPYARMFLRAKTQAGRRSVYLGLVASQLRLATLFAPLIVMGYAALNTISWWTAMWLFAFLASEALINESGRFFWNCGESDTASQRDLRRAALFSMSIILGIQIDGAVISPAPLALLTLSNLILFLFDFGTHHRQWAALHKVVIAAGQTATKLMQRTRRMMVNSKSQLVHMQLLSAAPFLERMSLEKALGLQTVGAYSFLVAIVSAAVTLFLLPNIAATRASYLGSNSTETIKAAHAQSLHLLARITLACTAFVVLGYLAIPWVTEQMNKVLPITVLISLSALTSVIAATYASAVAPMFADNRRIIRANLMTALAMLPLACALLLAVGAELGAMANWLTLAAIMASASLQIMMRAWHAHHQGGAHG